MERRPIADLRRSFGGRVHEARQAARISQAELAKRLGLRSGVAVGDWERGKALPKFETFMRLCEALNQSPAYFIEGYRDRPAKGRVETIQDAVDTLETKLGQRHLELIHRLEHLPVEIGRSIAPEELRAALEQMRCDDPATVEARLGAALPQRHGGRDDQSSLAREAFRQGWEAAHDAVRQWLHQRGRAV
jgi:HTH-type transcriptional regulator, cell division transcriptional repressor